MKKDIQLRHGFTTITIGHYDVTISHDGNMGNTEKHSVLPNVDALLGKGAFNKLRPQGDFRPDEHYNMNNDPSYSYVLYIPRADFNKIIPKYKAVNEAVEAPGDQHRILAKVKRALNTKGVEYSRIEYSGSHKSEPRFGGRLHSVVIHTKADVHHPAIRAALTDHKLKGLSGGYTTGVGKTKTTKHFMRMYESASDTARHMNVPSMYVERDGGAFRLRRGFQVVPGTKVAMIEDIVTTGLSSRECIQAIREAGGDVVVAGCIVDRSGGRADVGVPLVALATLDVPTYPADALPPELAALPIEDPGSRRLFETPADGVRVQEEPTTSKVADSIRRGLEQALAFAGVEQSAQNGDDQ